MYDFYSIVTVIQLCILNLWTFRSLHCFTTHSLTCLEYLLVMSELYIFFFKFETFLILIKITIRNITCEHRQHSCTWLFWWILLFKCLLNPINPFLLSVQAYTDYSDSVARRMGFIPLPLAVLVSPYAFYDETTVIKEYE